MRCARRSSSGSTDTTSPARSRRSGRRSVALNQHVEASAPWQLAKDEAKAGELDAVLYDLADGIVAVAVALAPYLPETAPRILAALGQSGDLSLDRIAAHDRRGGRGDPAVAAALPARGRGGASCVIDTHAHLDALDDPDAAVDARPDGGRDAAS